MMAIHGPKPYEFIGKIAIHGPKDGKRYSGPSSTTAASGHPSGMAPWKCGNGAIKLPLSLKLSWHKMGSEWFGASEFIGFGAMDCHCPYEFIGFGHGLQITHEFIWFGPWIASCPKIS